MDEFITISNRTAFTINEVMFTGPANIGSSTLTIDEILHDDSIKVATESIGGTTCEDALEFRVLHLPTDNWYTPDHVETHPAWGTCQPHLFALIDDGAGERWYPVEMS